MDLHARLMASTAGMHATTTGEECNFLNALIGGAVSLAGGLFGRSDAKKKDRIAAANHLAAVEEAKRAALVPVVTTTRAGVNLKRLVSDAMGAGFNPMSILNAGGLGSYAYGKTSTTGQNAGLPAQIMANAPTPTAPSVGSVIAGAASNAYNIYREDAAAKTAALASYPAAPQPNTGWAQVLGMGASQSGLSVPVLSAGVPTLGKAGVLAGSMPSHFEADTAKVSNPHGTALIDDGYANADSFADRYGDIAEEIFGARNAVVDTLANLYGKTQAERNAERATQQKLMGTQGMAINPTFGAAVQAATDFLQRKVGAGMNPYRPAAKTGYLAKDNFNDPFPAYAW